MRIFYPYDLPTTLFLMMTVLLCYGQAGAQNTALTSPFEVIEAEDYTSAFGVRPGGSGVAVGYIEDGDYLIFEDVDFGEDQLYNGIVRASSRTEGGTIEFRLGSTVGPLLATAAITGTGGWSSFRNFEIDLAFAFDSYSGGTPPGTVDLYLIFTGGGGYLFDVDNFVFSDEEVAITDLEITNCPSAPLLTGEVYDFDIAITPVNTTNKFVAFYASDGVSVDYTSGEFLTQTPGQYTVSTTSFSDGGVSDACTFEVTDGGQAAFNGPHTIPGTIEAEFYDLGGPGVAYRDDNRKQGILDFRSDDQVDVGRKSAASNGLAVGWTRDGEFLEYTLAEVTQGRYDITLTYSAGGTQPGDVLLSIDSEPRTSFNDLVNTGGWNTFATTTVKGVFISNSSVLRLTYRGAGFDLDKITFTPTPSSASMMTKVATEMLLRTSDVPEIISAYPNPSSDGFFTVASPQATTVRIIDVNGRVVQQRWVEAGTNTLDLSEQPTGIYFLRSPSNNLKLIRR